MNWSSTINLFKLAEGVERVAQYLRSRVEKRDTLEKLHEYGFTGGIEAAVDQALTLLDRQHQAIKDGNNALESEASKIKDAARAGERDSSFTVQYFIPYDATYTKYLNGGTLQALHGMTMINIIGGIRNWEDLMGVSHFIKTKTLTPKGIPANVTVRINGIFEVSRWTTNPQQLPSLSEP